MLSEAKVKNAKAKAKSYMLRDENGLYLKIDTAGRKYWILRYWEGKRERQISLGVYPEVSLKDARMKRDELQAARARGELLSVRPDKNPATFREAAAEWLKVRMKDKAESYVELVGQKMRKYILPAIGNMKLNDIKSPVILKLCRQIEIKEFYETAHRVRTLIGQVFKFAIASGYCDYDPTQALTGALTSKRHKH